MSDLLTKVTNLALAAQAAARQVAAASGATRAHALHAAAAEIRAAQTTILAANAQDTLDARAKGLSEALLDRLRLDAPRLEAIAAACEAVAQLPDPVGEVMTAWTRPNGLHIAQRRVPLGLIAVIFESRPNVTIDAAALCLRAGNACLLRGGSEALRTNQALAQAMGAGLHTAGLPAAAVTLIPFAEREAVAAIGSLRGVVDVLIPRGGPGLIAAVTNSAQVPVIKHDAGICHLYVHTQAKLDQALAITINAKCQRPSACNAAETLLVDATVAPQFLPMLARELAARATEIRACPRALAWLPGAQPVTDDDFRTEHLALILNVKVVDDLTAALTHITTYGSGHSEAIITQDAQVARSFLDRVDSACVYWNASTRFTDGGEFGFGSEIGISTDRLHARGPVGLKSLTTWKYEVTGQGQVRS